MAIDTESSRHLALPGALRAVRGRLLGWAKGLWPYLRFTTLTGRIIFLNLLVLVGLVISNFYFTNREKWLIEDRVQILRIQAEIMAAAIAARATVRTNQIELDPDLLEEAPRGPIPSSIDLSALEYSISPERIAPIIPRLLAPTEHRARIYDAKGDFVLDSASLDPVGAFARRKERSAEPSRPPVIKALSSRIRAWFDRRNLPLYQDIGRENGTAYEEVRIALHGQTTPILRVDKFGRTILSVAVPIRRLASIKGALLLSTRPGELDERLAAERWPIIKFSLAALVVIIFSSFFLASTIALPLQRLSQAAEKVRNSLRRRQELPDFTHRADEIGDLSGTLRAMTDTLYRRIEMSERFAADVAHELKNPLTSVRSAAETLAVVKTSEARQELAETIKSDVVRLTRLIDDIANASRLDADLALNEAGPVDVSRLLTVLVEMFNQSFANGKCRVELEIAEVPLGSGAYVVNGHDNRLGQVIRNLLENAVSFTPKNGRVRVKARAAGGRVRIEVEDDGPGIPPGNLEKIFRRFYTDRPESHGFAKNSGLGLSISREIVEAHQGAIWAENRLAQEELAGSDGADNAHPGANGIDRTRILGARFVVELPSADHFSRRGARGERRAALEARRGAGS